MSSKHAARPSLRSAGTFPAVSISPVKRFICHFLIVWLALLSGGAHAHAAADAAHEVGHMVMHASELQTGSAMAAPGHTETIDKAHGHAHTESCKLSHCGHGHATGMLPSLPLRLSDAPAAVPLPSAQAWASREQPDTIERPKWVHTTSLVVNL